jgi:hypothetical protein
LWKDRQEKKRKAAIKDSRRGSIMHQPGRGVHSVKGENQQESGGDKAEESYKEFKA